MQYKYPRCHHTQERICNDPDDLLLIIKASVLPAFTVRCLREDFFIKSNCHDKPLILNKNIECLIDIKHHHKSQRQLPEAATTSNPIHGNHKYSENQICQYLFAFRRLRMIFCSDPYILREKT